MTKGKKVKRAAVHGVKLFGIAALAVSPTAGHPGAHDAPKTPIAVEQAALPDLATPAGTVAKFHAALASGDTASALALLTEDVLIFESGGVERSRAEYASHHLLADAAFSAAVARKLVSRTHGAQGDTAWVMSIETVTGTYRNRAISSRSAETMVLRQVDGQWRIAHIHWSSADIDPAKP